MRKKSSDKKNRSPFNFSENCSSKKTANKKLNFIKDETSKNYNLDGSRGPCNHSL